MKKQLVWIIVAVLNLGCVRARATLRHTFVPVVLGERDAIGEPQVQASMHTPLGAYEAHTERVRESGQTNTGSYVRDTNIPATNLDMLAIEATQAPDASAPNRRAIRGLQIYVSAHAAAFAGAAYASARADVRGEVIEANAPPQQAPDLRRIVTVTPPVVTSPVVTPPSTAAPASRHRTTRRGTRRRSR